MANKILLNGTDFSDYAQELQDIDSITYQLNENGATVQKAVSTLITFDGAAFDFLFDKFFSNLAPFVEVVEVDVELIIDCCEVSLGYTITANSIELCPDICEFRVNLEKVDINTKGFDFLNRTRILDNDAVNNITTPHLEYCNGKGFRGLGAALFVVLQAVFIIINFIISVVTLGQGEGIDFELIDGLLGCDKQAPGFHLRQALEFQANNAGLTLSTTTTLDVDNYQNSIILPMQFIESDNDCPDLDVLLENRVNLTTIDFMTTIEPIFSAQKRIKNGILYFENDVWFDDNLINAGDVSIIDFGEGDICYLYDLEARFKSLGRFEYGYDSRDIYSSNAAFVYNDIVEWNPSGNEQQKDELATFADSYSPLMFMGIRPEYYDPDNTLGFLLHHAIVNEGISEKLKIYAWNGLSECSAKVININDFNNHNYPFFFPSIPNPFDPTNPFKGLYENFHSHKDPNNLTQYPLRTNNFIFQPESFCDFIAILENDGTDIYLDSPYGKIKPDSVVVNFNEQTIQFNDTKIIEYS